MILTDTYDRFQFSCLQQGSEEWKKARLGYFSGSQIGLLMKSGKSNMIFGDTAMSYIYEVAAKRRLLPAFVEGDGWIDYKLRTEVHSKSMQWGNDFEPIARREYEQRNNCEVYECGFIIHPEIKWLGDSPDGIVTMKDTNMPLRAIEIKCPDSKTYVRYQHELKTAISLQTVNWDYYWQCLCHMSVNGVQEVDFICYDPMLKDGYLQYRMYRDECQCDIDKMEERVKLANEIIEQINNNQ